jgi:hypothetical protein
MSYTLKYRYTFKSFDDNDCRVDIFIKDAAAGLTILNPGARPFILREFNSDNDFFKPTRGFIAEMEILSNNVSMDAFLNDEDDGVQVQFYFNGTSFWTGWLMQDDFEENWIDTNHYITLRATDGLGTVSSDPMPQVTGQAPIIDYIGYALDATPLNFLDRRVVCNLFYLGMDDRADGEYNPLDSATVDGRTFQGDNQQTVLEKIMKAWSMTVYQWYGKWFVARLEEWLTNNPIYGLLEEFLLPDVQFNNTYEVNIGVDEPIKPIMPEMLRSIKRPAKYNKIEYYYKFPDEIVCNQTFLEGDLIIPTTDTYEIDCWTLLKGTITSPSAGTANFWRVVDVDGDGNIIDNFAFIAGDATIHYAKSSEIFLNNNDTIKISFDFRGQRNTGVGPANQNIGNVEFINADTLASYWLDDDGSWNTTTKSLTMSYSSLENENDWKNYDVTSKGVPGNGSIFIYLQSSFGVNTDANFKGLDIEIREASKQPGVIGDYDLYTLPDKIDNSYTEEIFLDDSNNKSHKGALHFSGDLTGDNWYRMDFPTERLTFKRHKAIAHMFFSKRYKQRLQVNMFGNTWMDGSTLRPIWLQNKFVFVDDAPTKKFMITNLSEMNFMDATWKADLIEVWDSGLDDNTPENYPATHTFANIYEKDK